MSMTGYSSRNLWRMMQFFETYHDQPKLATLLRELSWSHHLAIMSRCKRDEEREFYLRLTRRERWSFRELQRQLSGALFERTVLSPVELSTPLAELHPEASADIAILPPPVAQLPAAKPKKPNTKKRPKKGHKK